MTFTDLETRLELRHPAMWIGAIGIHLRPHREPQINHDRPRDPNTLMYADAGSLERRIETARMACAVVEGLVLALRKAGIEASAASEGMKARRYSAGLKVCEGTTRIVRLWTQNPDVRLDGLMRAHEQATEMVKRIKSNTDDLKAALLLAEAATLDTGDSEPEVRAALCVMDASRLIGGDSVRHAVLGEWAKILKEETA